MLQENGLSKPDYGQTHTAIKDRVCREITELSARFIMAEDLQKSAAREDAK